MSTLNLRDVCEKLTSNHIRTRQPALNDLQRFLNSGDASSRLVDENAHACLIETLIKNFSIELAGFRKSNSSQATSLLHLSAECFRASVENARTIMKRPTVKLAVTHILDSLASPGKPEYRELAPCLFASLRVITSYPPHVEQMKKDMWKDLAQLCMSNIHVSNRYNLSIPSSQPLDNTKLEDDPYPSSGYQGTLSMRKEIADLMFCFQSLCSFPGAPIYGDEETLLTFFMNFLASYDTASDARTSAAISLNRILEHVIVNKTELAYKASPAIVDLTSRIWNSRIPGFRDRLLISLCLIYPYLHKHVIENGLNPMTQESVRRLTEKLKNESRNHDQKGGLQVDDLILASLPVSSTQWRNRPYQFFVGPFFSLNPFSKSAESAWLSLQLQASFVHLLDLASSKPNESPGDIDIDHHRKRRRLSPNASLQEILDDILLPKSHQISVLSSLQRLAFYLNSFRTLLDLSVLSNILNCLETIRDQNNADIAGWALVCILGIVGRTETMDVSEAQSDQWARIWIACLKQASLPSTCRASCAVMEAILRKGILSVRFLLPHIKGIIEFVEQRGPGLFIDSACEFWNTLMRKLREAGFASENWGYASLTRWIRFRLDVAGLNEPISMKNSALLVFPCLRLFSLVNPASEYSADFDYIVSVPQTALGESLTNITIKMPLVNFLLESYVDCPSTCSESSEHMGRSEVEILASLREVLQEKCHKACMVMKGARDRSSAQEGFSISCEDLSWFTLFAMLGMLLSCTGFLC